MSKTDRLTELRDAIVRRIARKNFHSTIRKTWLWRGEERIEVTYEVAGDHLVVRLVYEPGRIGDTLRSSEPDFLARLTKLLRGYGVEF